MKTRHIVEAIAIACIVYAMSGCATTTGPDGSTSQRVDPLAYQAALVALAEYQRQHPVTPEK